MPPKKRNKENQGLPNRWVKHHGAYYYRVPPNLRHEWSGKTKYRLGKTLAEAHTEFAKHLTSAEKNCTTIGQLLNRYTIETIPTKAPTTQSDDLLKTKTLKAIFNDVNIEDFSPQMAYQFLDKFSKKHGVTTANRHISLLSHAFTCAIRWGLIDNHPIIGKVKKLSTKPRDRYVTDKELKQALKLANDTIKAYIPLKVLTGLRRGDILSLTLAHVKEDGIHIMPNKTAKTSRKRIIICWTDELLEAVNNAKRLRKKNASIYLFHKGNGQPFINKKRMCSGFDSMWRRFMTKVVDAGIKRFQERDLRAKTATDASSIQHAQSLLAHTNTKVTQKHYYRLPEKVQPISKK